MRGPVVVVEVAPGHQVGVDRHRVGDAEVGGAAADIADLLLEGVLRGVDPDDLQARVPVDLVEFLDAGDGALAVDAGVRPEIDEGDLAGAVGVGQELLGRQIGRASCRERV